MHKFFKIATQMFPAERIETLDRNANINGEIGIEVKLFGIPETFQYTGQYASLAWDVLNGVVPAIKPPSVTPTISVSVNGNPTLVELVKVGNEEYRFVLLGDEIVNANNIEWVDFESNGGIELRLSTDALGVIRKFVGKQADAVYDALVLLASNLEEAAAGN